MGGIVAACLRLVLSKFQYSRIGRTDAISRDFSTGSHSLGALEGCFIIGTSLFAFERQETISRNRRHLLEAGVG